MKKFLLLTASLTFGLLFSQKSKGEKPKNSIPSNPYHQSQPSDTIQKENSKISFYKNVDSANASKYRMLSKKPSEQYSELPQNKETTQKEKNK